ncbi:MAG: HD-GYP domain-containing protein [Pseudobdellovibrionaceae bacterium]
MSSASNRATESPSDDQVIEVSKDFFFEGMTLPANIYIKMNPNNYLLIGKKGDKAAFSNLHAFKKDEFGVYVNKLEYAVLIQQVTLITSKVLEQKTIPDSVKVRFLTSLTDDAMSSLKTSGFSSVAKIQKVSQLVTQMSQQVNAFNDILDILKSLPNDDAKHVMTTCMIAMLLCEEMNVNLPQAQEKVAMGALLHDVGLKFVPKEILEKPKHLLTPDEVQIYEQHPLKSVEMLRDIKDVPQDVLFIVAEHHENAQGTGFPKKLRDIKISPLGKIVGLADLFSELLFNQKPEGKSFTPDEAVTYIDDILGQPFNKQTFLALKNIINKKHLADKS